jgi:hypothetical protein
MGYYHFTTQRNVMLTQHRYLLRNVFFVQRSRLIIELFTKHEALLSPYSARIFPTEAAFLVFLRYDAGTILETMPKLGYDHRTAFSEKQQGR